MPPKEKFCARNPLAYGVATNPGPAIWVFEHPGSGASLKVTVPVAGKGRLPSVTSTAEYGNRFVVGIYRCEFDHPAGVGDGWNWTADHRIAAGLINLDEFSRRWPAQ